MQVEKPGQKVYFAFWILLWFAQTCSPGMTESPFFTDSDTDSDSIDSNQ